MREVRGSKKSVETHRKPRAQSRERINAVTMTPTTTSSLSLLLLLFTMPRRNDSVPFTRKVQEYIMPLFDTNVHCYEGIEEFYNSGTQNPIVNTWQQQSPFSHWQDDPRFQGFEPCICDERARPDSTGQKPCAIKFATFQSSMRRIAESNDVDDPDTRVPTWTTSTKIPFHQVSALVGTMTSDTFEQEVQVWADTPNMVVCHDCDNGRPRPDNNVTCTHRDHMSRRVQGQNRDDQPVFAMLRQASRPTPFVTVVDLYERSHGATLGFPRVVIHGAQGGNAENGENEG